MADVWQARDMVLERQVAVKVLHPHLAADAHFVGRFLSGAAAARCTTPRSSPSSTRAATTASRPS
jgi:serine/threonine-protein kinase